MEQNYTLLMKVNPVQYIWHFPKHLPLAYANFRSADTYAVQDNYSH